MTLKERLKESDIYDLGNGQNRLISGGDISNTLPFDSESGLYVPESYFINDAVNAGSGWWKYIKGRFGYAVNIQQGIIRVYPVRGYWDRFVEISAITPTQLDYRNIGDKTLELYKDTANVRWSFFIGDRGFKTVIKVKDGYSGNGQFKLGFRLEGLTREECRIYNNQDFVGRLPKSFGWDSSTDAEPFDVDESIVDDEVILEADLSGKIFPVFIDPQLVVDPIDADGLGTSNAPTTVGVASYVRIGRSASFRTRSAFKSDISSIPANSTIDSVTQQVYYYAWLQADPNGQGYQPFLYRIIPDITPGVGMSWNNYDAGSAWNTAMMAGTNTDYSTTNPSQTTAAITAFGWYYWTDANIIAQVKDALDNRSGILRQGFTREALPTGESAFVSQIRFYAKAEVVQTTLRPKLTIDYTEPSAIKNLSRSRMVNSGNNARLSRGGIINAN
jgi:hypothetical protein